jgi:radical SAM superfamily enzyme YgiQ (UPF0313 family)
MKIRRITILRVDPESSNVYADFAHPGLAVSIIGTILKNAGYEVAIYVDAIQPAPWEALAESDLVAFTVNTACFRETYRLADRVRREVGCPIVYGGPHVTFKPEEALRHGEFVVRGEGEETILELVRALEAGEGEFGGIHGLSWRDGSGRVRHNLDRPLSQEIDIIPDQSLIQGFREFYRRPSQRFSPTGMLVSTSRGCPFKCTFCTIPQTTGSAMRYRNHDSIVADIRQQMAFSGHPYIYFADDNFAVHRKNLKKLLQRFIDEKLNMRFSTQIRAETTNDPELMDLLRDAGCYLVFVGYESLNDTTLAEYQKGGRQNFILIESSVKEFHKRGIMVHGMFVIGSDHDHRGTALRTAQWAEEQGLESLQMLPICPLPGTQLLAKLESEGRVFKAWDDDLGGEYIPYGAGNYVLYEPAQMTAIELQEDLVEAYLRFYSTPNLLRAALKVVSRGTVQPALIQMMGRRLLRGALPDVQAHMRWLNDRSAGAQELRRAS